MVRVSLLAGRAAEGRNEAWALRGGPRERTTYLSCAGQLDRLARDHGGEAFELEGAICCLVERRHSDAVVEGPHDRIAVTLDLETDVIVS